MSKPVMEDLFSFSGRRNRKSYIFYSLIIGAITIAVIFIATMMAGLAGGAASETATEEEIGASVGIGIMIGFVILIPVMISSLAVSTQRCRDFGWTGWAVLIMLIPYVGFAFQIALMVIPGNAGENRYGPDPLGGTAPVSVEPTA